MKRLWRKLFGPSKPTLVIPVPEIGPQPDQLERALGTNFLWPPDGQGKKGLRLPPPPHSEWRTRYNAVKNGRITYVAEGAQTHLMSLITNDRGLPIRHFGVEPMARPEPVIKMKGN